MRRKKPAQHATTQSLSIGRRIYVPAGKEINISTPLENLLALFIPNAAICLTWKNGSGKIALGIDTVLLLTRHTILGLRNSDLNKTSRVCRRQISLSFIILDIKYFLQSLRFFQDHFSENEFCEVEYKSTRYNSNIETSQECTMDQRSKERNKISQNNA